MAEISGLREAFNQVAIVGTLEEKNLEKKVDSNGQNYIAGNLVIGYGDNKKIKVGYYSKEFKKNSTEISKIYKGLETVIEEYVSRAEALKCGKDASEVSVVSILGKFAPYDVPSKKTGEIISGVNVKANFVERVDVTPDKFGATFSVEMYVEDIEDEIINNAPTGRVKLGGIVPIFAGQVMPITLYTTTDESRGGNVGAYVKEHYEVGKTVQVNGVVDCRIEHKEYVKEGMFGSLVTTFDNVTNEFVVVDGIPAPYLITDPKHYNKETIKAAMLHRDEYLESLKNKNSTTSTAPSMPTPGFASSFATPTSTDEETIDF